MVEEIEFIIPLSRELLEENASDKKRLWVSQYQF
jgi:hypothetical protein